MSAPKTALPKGQRARADFPRFGLSQFANRFPTETNTRSLHVDGDVASTEAINLDGLGLKRTTLQSNFHCVTTWTTPNLIWSGFRFTEIFEECLKPRWEHANEPTVVFKCQDGFRANLPLEDLLAENVLLVDRLNDQPLTIAHGSPWRLLAPAHYGYKNAKHLKTIELWRSAQMYKSPGLKFMDHPRARVDLEERGRGLPGWVYRYLYRPLIASTVRQFAQALEKHENR